MTFRPLRFEPYDATESVANVVVDGSPNPGTVLTLSHWPGLTPPADPDLWADLSAQMAMRYVASSGAAHGSAEVATNNHFDQDGLVSLYALTRPEDALARRALLEDLAAAGDFATYQDRRAARLSMVIAAYADGERSPLAPFPADYGQTTALLYAELLDRLPHLVDRLDAHRPLWEDEDHRLVESEEALANGSVRIDEHPEVDLAVVTLPDAPVGGRSGHRFAHLSFDGIHPMALHNATDRFAVLLVSGRCFSFTYRYETWVQYRSRRPRARVDLTACAEQLTALETGGVRWQADPVGALTPQLRPAGDAESSLAPADVVVHIKRHLAEAPPAWDPYA